MVLLCVYLDGWLGLWVWVRVVCACLCLCLCVCIEFCENKVEMVSGHGLENGYFKIVIFGWFEYHGRI